MNRCLPGSLSVLSLVLAASVALCLPGRASARNVDLSTVPARETVQLTIYNSEDLTLVRETRQVTFKKGVNPLQFSWANTLIDPTSVELRFLSSPEKLEVLDTTYPHDKPQMLYWNVQSDFDGLATIEITYFTSGISWTADYTLVADQKETQLNLDGFVKISNNCGEAYENAHVRLVVGTINLVEKIAQLAQTREIPLGNLQVEERLSLRREAAQSMLKDAAAAPAASAPEPKQIIKQGLSEYFIYNIEGTETIDNGWSKRLRSLQTSATPFKVVYRYRPQEYGEGLVRMYILTNDKASKLGSTPLPDGMVRVFRENGRDGLNFLAAQPTKYVPIGDKIELNLGADPNVIFELIKQRSFRDQIWLRINGGDLLRRADDGAAKIEVNSSVVGWDNRETFAQRIRNYSPSPIDVEIRRPIPGDVIFRSQLKPVLHDYRTVELKTQVAPGKKEDLSYELILHQGTNAHQERITLETAAVAQ